MIAISALTPSLSCRSLRPHLSHRQTLHSNPSFCPKPSSIHPQTTLIRNRTAVLGSNSNDPKESAFMDENGAVDDMDGYMNYLSLEYDSVWDTKPSWYIRNCGYCTSAYSDMIAERRKKVTDGVEDTFGLRNTQ
ncbi:hypothetical protein C3L33_07486, partial [Rhododendron williamsianum]